MFLAILRIPAVADAEARAAAATGLALHDVRRRLVGTLPRVLVVAADADEIEAARQRLEAAGFVAVAFAPTASPTDDDRIVARTLEPGADALTVVVGIGHETRHTVPWDAIELVQRGVKSAVKRSEVTTVARELSLGRTLLAGGIPIRRKVERKETVDRTEEQPFAICHRRDGGDDIMLYERRLDYGFLGARRGPVGRTNLDETVALVRARSGAAADDRVARPGFVAGIPASSADPVDVALHLVRLARLVAR